MRNLDILDFITLNKEPLLNLTNSGTSSFCSHESNVFGLTRTATKNPNKANYLNYSIFKGDSLCQEVIYLVYCEGHTPKRHKMTEKRIKILIKKQVQFQFKAPFLSE